MDFTFDPITSPRNDEMLAAMQAIQNPTWWRNMMMPGLVVPLSYTSLSSVLIRTVSVQFLLVYRRTTSGSQRHARDQSCVQFLSKRSAAACRLKTSHPLRHRDDTPTLASPLFFPSIIFTLFTATRGGWQQFNLNPLNNFLIRLFFFLRSAHLGLSVSPGPRGSCSLARRVVRVI